MSRKYVMNGNRLKSATTIAKALECYRMASEEERHTCEKRTCPFNNNSATYGTWCCGNSIMFDNPWEYFFEQPYGYTLEEANEQIKKLKKQIDRVWTGK